MKQSFEGSKEDTVLLLLEPKSLTKAIAAIRQLIEQGSEVVAATPAAMTEINEAVVAYRDDDPASP